MVGEGNKKEVYLGYDTQDEREVAVTLVKTHILTPQQVDQIRVGAESMSTVGDQVAAPLYLDVGEDQGYIYMISAALEYIEERILNPNFLLVASGTLLVAESLSILHPTLPLHVQAIGGTATDVSRVVGIMGLSQLLVRPFVGWLIDGGGLDGPDGDRLSCHGIIWIDTGPDARSIYDGRWVRSGLHRHSYDGG